MDSRQPRRLSVWQQFKRFPSGYLEREGGGSMMNLSHWCKFSRLRSRLAKLSQKQRIGWKRTSVDASKRGAFTLAALAAGLSFGTSANADTAFTSFAYPLTGAPTSQTTLKRFADLCFDVADYGALGNNIQDDAPKVRDAVTAALNNGIILFPKGSFKFNSAVLIPTGSSLIFTGTGDGSSIIANFNGFAFDNLSSFYNAVGAVSVIEKLKITNAYTGNNFAVTAGGTWSSSGSPVSITLSGANPGVAAGGALVINDSRFSTNSVFVGMITSVASWPTVTVSSAAVSSGVTANLAMRVVQCYAAGTSWGPISSGTYNSGTGVISLTTATAVTSFVLAGDALPISVNGTGTNIGALNGTWNVLSSSGTAVTLQGPTGQGAITISGGNYSPLRLTMASTPPTGISGQYYVYDYEDILADRKTNFNRGVATWSGTTLTFTPGTAVVGNSVGSSDRLWFAPVAGCVRYSSVVGATVRDCTISGFIGVTDSQDKIVANDPTVGAAEGFEITVERCNFSNPSGCSAVTGQTGIYLQNNSLAYYNSFNSMWGAIRLSGTSCSVIGGRMEVGYFGILLAGDDTATNNASGNTILATLSMESNLLGLYVGSGGSININAVGIICNAVNPIGGMYFNSIGSSVVQNSAAASNFGTGYAIFVADAGNTAGHIVFMGCSAVNTNTPSQSWRLPAQAWWGTCDQCDNPALEYTFANLPSGVSSPAPVQGETYDILDCSTSTFLATAAAGGSGATAHRRVRYNATAAVWQVVG
jgi:hypothetical protein